MKIKVKSHKRGGKKVKGYLRNKRPKGKRKMISRKPVKLYPIRDEYGRVLGFSKNPGR